MTDDELGFLLRDLESDRVERKESISESDKIRQAICAFANDLPDRQLPGVLFVGAKDDGTCASLDITDGLLLTIADMKTDGNILPIPSMTVEKRRVGGCTMAVVVVQPADAPPVRFKGRIWVRTGPRRGIASAQDERILNEKRRHRDLPYDLQPVPHARLTDLSKRIFEEEYVPNAFSSDVIQENNRTFEERLSACRMVAEVDSPVPTVLGCLVLSPRARDILACDYVQFLRIDGEDLSDPIIDEESVSGPLSDMLRLIDEKVEAHIRTAVDIAGTQREERRPDYPVSALQQLIRNAVIHRTYENTNSPVRITWLRDRIEILSPGGPYGVVNKVNFGLPGITDYRNPHLAEAMKVLGYVQRFGIGIGLARKALEENGNPPPVFQVEDNFVHVTVRGQQ
jgi:ATP-dependent DNA helicase RecG